MSIGAGVVNPGRHEDQPRVLVTGANGFVGRVLLEALPGFRVRAATRSGNVDLPAGVEQIAVGEINEVTDWSRALTDVRFVVHLAARVHVMDKRNDALALYERTNVLGTRRLVEDCVRSGIQRLVILSSIKVNGETSGVGVFSADDFPMPSDAYAVSKQCAEKAAFDAAASSSLLVSVIRPPLVYGPGVRANFRRLLSWAARGIPMPFGSVENLRSLVSVWNLCDLIRALLEIQPGVGGVFLVSDGEDVSTPDLIRRLSLAVGRTPRLVPVSMTLLRLLGRITGKEAELSRLTSSLAVDIRETHRRLGWTPPLSLDAGLRRTAQWYMSEERGP